MRAALLGVMVMALSAAPARADEYELVARSAGGTLESGEMIDQAIELRNTGAATWNDVTLTGPLMVQPVVAATTAPGAANRFAFSVKAPVVTASTPVHAEFTASSAAGGWTGAPVAIDYTVLPSQRPVVHMLPPEVSADGMHVTIGVVAVDNVAIAHVFLSVSGSPPQEVQVGPDGKTYRATFPYVYCSGSGYRVIDRAGNEASVFATPSCAALPPKLVGGALTSRFTANRRGTLARSLFITGAPKGAQVVLTCKGGGCPFKHRDVAVEGAITNLRPLLKGRRLRAGAVLEVRIDAPRMTASVTRFTMRKRLKPRAERLCQPPGRKDPGACG